jgi:hypothetical protein
MDTTRTAFGADVDLLYVAGCPNLELARDRLSEAVRRAGVEATIREREITDEAEAVALGMRGSPTILVRGEDVDGGGKTPGSMSCRQYATEAGVEGAPTVDEILAAFNR